MKKKKPALNSQIKLSKETVILINMVAAMVDEFQYESVHRLFLKEAEKLGLIITKQPKK